MVLSEKGFGLSRKGFEQIRIETSESCGLFYPYPVPFAYQHGQPASVFYTQIPGGMLAESFGTAVQRLCSPYNIEGKSCLRH